MCFQHTLYCLGIYVNSIKRTFTLPREKKGRIISEFLTLLEKSSLSIKELSQLVGDLEPAINKGQQQLQCNFNKLWGQQKSEITIHRYTSVRVKEELNW